ncbi:uncharacterized protein DS421_5g140130 [Arachis hypogaea]|nr:uncharacterized protein DS421_5g140130 [Arachis hypogaea]
MARYRYSGSPSLGFPRTGGAAKISLKCRKASSHAGVHSNAIPFFMRLKNGRAFAAEAPRNRESDVNLPANLWTSLIHPGLFI